MFHVCSRQKAACVWAGIVASWVVLAVLVYVAALVLTEWDSYWASRKERWHHCVQSCQLMPKAAKCHNLASGSCFSIDIINPPSWWTSWIWAKTTLRLLYQAAMPVWPWKGSLFSHSNPFQTEMCLFFFSLQKLILTLVFLFQVTCQAESGCCCPL